MTVTLYGGPYDGDTLGVPLGHTRVRLRTTDRRGGVRVYVYELAPAGQDATSDPAGVGERFVYAREEVPAAESR